MSANLKESFSTRAIVSILLLTAGQASQACPIFAQGFEAGIVGGTLVTTTAELINAIDGGQPDDCIELAAVTFVIEAPLRPKAGMSIRGAGVGQTQILSSPSWLPLPPNLPAEEVNASRVNRQAYLFDLGNGRRNITISDITLASNNKLHGAIFCDDCDNVDLGNLVITNFAWSGLRLFRVGNGRIHDNIFLNAGGKDSWSGITGGSIFATYSNAMLIENNRFTKDANVIDHVYGLKGREMRNSRITNNTFLVNFAIELPFENDYTVEIDHNYLNGTLSLPKYSGGSVPAGTFSFHVHHNVMLRSYSFEFDRNKVIIDHNLFNFSAQSDGGHLITSFFGSGQPTGNLQFFDNLIANPGRGLFTNTTGQVTYPGFYFFNNHVRGVRTVNSRSDGLFGFPSSTDFSTVEIRDNIFELDSFARPLVRNAQSYNATVINNTFVNISDAAMFANPSTGDVRGPREPLIFNVGQYGEYAVDDWNVSGPLTR